jgi:predicted phage terminase large subunit-like protein
MAMLIDHVEKHRPAGHKTYPHIRQLCQVLERGILERKNVMIETGPRTFKTEHAAVYAPSWDFESHQEQRWAYFGSTDGFAQRAVTGTAGVILSPQYREDNPHVQIIQQAGSRFKLAGMERSLDDSYAGYGLDAQGMGRGFDTVVLDDLFASGAAAKSPAKREAVYTNVVTKILNRMEKNTIIISICSRLHLQDQQGMLADTGLKFLRLHLPSIAEKREDAWFHDDYSGKRTNLGPFESLIPGDRERLEMIRATVSPYWWAAQQQQDPSNKEVTFFNSETMQRYFHTVCEQVWISLDANQKETTTGSYAALVCLGSFQGMLKVLGVRRGRWSQPVLHDQVRDFYRAMSVLSGILPEAVCVEDAAAGRGVIDFLRRELPIVEVSPRGSKEERAGAVCYLNNRIMLPERAPWLADFVSELDSFPLSAYKDQVDSLVHGLSYCSRPAEFTPTQLPADIVQYDALEGSHSSIDSDGDEFYSLCDEREQGHF